MPTQKPIRRQTRDTRTAKQHSATGKGAPRTLGRPAQTDKKTETGTKNPRHVYPYALDKSRVCSAPLPELLAPAGSPAALAAAVTAGADAVYLGGASHNARVGATNFTEAEIAVAIADCHRVGVRVYVTMNTLLWDRELPEALAFAARLYEMGADALIVADLGFAALVHHYLPDFPLHASTQMSAHNSAHAALLAKLGFVRMVCAREMPKAEIDALVAASPIEIEQFVHGALCVSHSGQCLASAMMGGRSGNRGACAQPCRMKYGTGYPLSLKDMSLARHVPALIASGVHSLKIEGRMKSPAYVGGVVAVWRQLLDERRAATDAELAHLAGLFSRSGLTDGYYLSRFAEMCGVRTDADKAASRSIVATKTTLPVRRRRTPIVMSRTTPVLPQYAIDTFFETYQDGLARRIVPPRRGVRAGFLTAEVVPDGYAFLHVDLPLDVFDGRVADEVRLPPVAYDGELADVRAKLERAIDAGATRVRVTNLGQYAMARASGLTLVADMRLNVANSVTALVLYGLGFAEVTVSPELTLPRLRDFRLPFIAMTYGRLPLMLLERDPGSGMLCDRTGARFPIRIEGGRRVLYNSVPLYMCDRHAALEKAHVTGEYFLFTTERAADVLALLAADASGASATKPIRRMLQK